MSELVVVRGVITGIAFLVLVREEGEIVGDDSKRQQAKVGRALDEPQGANQDGSQ